eukprot:c15596_g2_i1 orf=2-205(-)
MPLAKRPAFPPSEKWSVSQPFFHNLVYILHEVRQQKNQRQVLRVCTCAYGGLKCTDRSGTTLFRRWPK